MNLISIAKFLHLIVFQYSQELMRYSFFPLICIDISNNTNLHYFLVNIAQQIYCGLFEYLS